MIERLDVGIKPSQMHERLSVVIIIMMMMMMTMTMTTTTTTVMMMMMMIIIIIETQNKYKKNNKRILKTQYKNITDKIQEHYTHIDGRSDDGCKPFQMHESSNIRRKPVHMDERSDVGRKTVLLLYQNIYLPNVMLDFDIKSHVLKYGLSKPCLKHILN